MDRDEDVKVLPVTRRKLLVGAAAGGGLLLAWYTWPRRYPSPLTVREEAGETGFGGWLVVGSDGIVRVALPQLEMGQGVGTLLAQVAAVELGADWRQMAIEPVAPGGFFANLPLAAYWSPLWEGLLGAGDAPQDRSVRAFAGATDFTATAAGTSLAAYEQQIRVAAASARDMLVRAAAARWDVAPETCEVDQGFVRQGSRRAPFGDLAQEASAFDPPDPAPLRTQPASEQPLAGEGEVGSAYPRLDLPSKVDGSHVFAGDVRLPGMVFASIRHGPVGLPELLRFDEGAVAGMRGVAGVVRSKRWLAAVADSWWTADRALAAMRPQFTGPGALESDVLSAQMERAVEGGDETATRIATLGEPDAFLSEANIVRRFDFAPAAHAPLETATATARLGDGVLELWIAAQAPAAARDAAASAVGLSPRDVVLYPMPAGGSFDARLEKQHAIEVAQIAAQIGRPVQLTYSRAQDFQSVPPRAPVVCEIVVGLGPQAQPQAWRTRVTSPSWMRETGHRLFDNFVPESAQRDSREQADPFAVEGGMPPYGIGHVAVEHVPAGVTLPAGRLRGGAHGYTAFATECVVDEMAANAGRDPFLYRMAMLGGYPRLAEVLRRATRLGDWDGAREGSGEGVAVVRMWTDPARSGHIACVAHIERGAGGIRVRQLSAVVDIGRIVNIDLARQQIEGGLLYGLDLALGAPLQFDKGHPVPRTFGQMGLPGFARVPDMRIDFVSSEAEPFDPGELGVAVVAPAVANALFTLTGERVYRLPF